MAHAQKSDLVFRRKGPVHLNRRDDGREWRPKHVEHTCSC